MSPPPKCEFLTPGKLRIATPKSRNYAHAVCAAKRTISQCIPGCLPGIFLICNGLCESCRRLTTAASEPLYGLRPHSRNALRGVRLRPLVLVLPSRVDAENEL